ACIVRASSTFISSSRRRTASGPLPDELRPGLHADMGGTLKVGLNLSRPFRPPVGGVCRPRASTQGASALGGSPPAFQAEAFPRGDIASTRPPPTGEGTSPSPTQKPPN